jgi:type II secretory pathway component PulL
MAKLHLIIDIAKDSIHAGVFSTKKMQLKRLFTHRIDGNLKEALSSILQDMEKEGYKDLSRVVVGLPAESITIRVMTLPFSDKKKIEEVIPFEVEDTLITGVSETLTEAIPLADSKTMAVAIEKNILRGYLDIFKEIGIDPVWIGVSLFSKDRLLKDIYDGNEAAAFLDRNSIVVVKDQMPFFFKEIKDDMDLRLALASLDQEGIDIKRFYCTEGMVEKLNELGKEVTPFNRYHNGETGLYALAAHFNEGFKRSINFRKGEFASIRESKAAIKDIKAAAILLALFIGLWVGYLYLQHKTLNSEMAIVKENLSATYRELFPEESSVVDAVYQLEVKLKGLREKKKVIGRGARVLDIIRELSEATGNKDNLRLYQLQIHGRKITAKGETDSFEGANRFKNTLASLSNFEDIILTDVKAKAGGGVNFLISFATKGVQE